MENIQVMEKMKRDIQERYSRMSPPQRELFMTLNEALGKFLGLTGEEIAGVIPEDPRFPPGE